MDIYNGGTTGGLAGKMSAALVALDYKAGAIQNASAQSQTVQPGTRVFYGAGADANAVSIAAECGATAVRLRAVARNAGRGRRHACRHVERIGGLGGGSVTVAPNAPYGITCVY